MTTPPLDLPTLRAKLRITKVTDNAEVLALLDRLEAAERDLAAVTVSRDGWKTRAEAAEKAVAAVREIHKPKKSWNGRDYCVSCFTDQGYDGAFGVLYPCPTITALDGVPNA